MDHWWLVLLAPPAISILAVLYLSAVRVVRWAAQTLMLAVIILLAMYLLKGLASRSGA